MTITETTKRKLRVAVGASALALATLSGTVRGEATEKAETSRPDNTVTAQEITAAQRKQMFKEAVRLGADPDEIVQYMDFPAYMPVTDGYFDEVKAQKYAEKLIPYAKEIQAKGKDMSVEEARKLFTQITGKDISADEFAQLQDAFREASAKNTCPAAGICFCGVLCFIAAVHTIGGLFGGGRGCASVVVGLPATLLFGFGVNVLTSDYPGKSIPQGYQEMYKTYVEQTIKAEKNDQIHKAVLNKVRPIVDKGNER